jgi:N-ethylmaleimide reductase
MKLFAPASLGNLKLQNRIVMAPMTRSRAIENIPNSLMAEYYGQRSSAGLIVTEGTSPSPNGLGYARIPGLFSPEQRDGWRLVTDAVHAGGSRIFVQLMHAGRVGSVLNLPPGAELLAPSAVAMNGKIWTDSQGEQPYDLPRTMNAADIKTAVNEYADAASKAVAAGFDGVEIHGANGYLITQFLDPASNLRHDEYGGDSERRSRFAVDVAEAVVEAIGCERVGIRLSPYGVFNDMSGDYPGIGEQYIALAKKLGGLKLAYLHMVDHSAIGAPVPDAAAVSAICSAFRSAGGGAVILSGGYDCSRAEADLENGAADLIAFGRPFIANPDLVSRLRDALPLAQLDQGTFYTPGPAGYTDYPEFTRMK